MKGIIMSKKKPTAEADAMSGVAEPPRFAAAMADVLEDHGLSQVALAATLGTSASYVSAVMKGKKTLSPQRIDEISDTIGLNAAERVRLHRTAAQDRGFRLDLPEDF